MRQWTDQALIFLLFSFLKCNPTESFTPGPCRLTDSQPCWHYFPARESVRFLLDLQSFGRCERPSIGYANFHRKKSSVSLPSLHSSAPSSSLGDISPLGSLYMLLLALQYGCQPILTQLYAPTNIVRAVYVLVQDSARLSLAAVLLMVTGSWKTAIEGWTWQTALVAAGFPAALYALQNYCSLMAYQTLPPLTYNVLNQTKTISAALFCYLLLNQRQSAVQMMALILLMTAALIMESILPLPVLSDRRKSHRFSQHVSRTERGSMPVKANHDTDDDNSDGTQSQNTATPLSTAKAFPKAQRLRTGLIPIALASATSGLAGAWVQRSVQSQSRNSLLLTMELAAISSSMYVTSLVIQGFSLLSARHHQQKHPQQHKQSSSLPIASSTTSDRNNVSREDKALSPPSRISARQLVSLLFQGWTWKTWLPIGMHAAGGVLAGLVTKHAGTIRKGWALMLGVFVSGVLQNVLAQQQQHQQQEPVGSPSLAASTFSWKVTTEQWVGAFLALFSLWMHAHFPPSRKRRIYLGRSP